MIFTRAATSSHAGNVREKERIFSFKETTGENSSHDSKPVSWEKNTAEIKKEINTINIETLYVLSIRLYDLGKKYEAVYWFYNAQMRARVFMDSLDPNKIGSIGSTAFELKHAFLSFNELAGTYINGHAFGDIDKLIKVLNKVLEENTEYNPSKVYPKVKFLSKRKMKKIQKDYIDGLKEMIDYVVNNKEEIYRLRKENGIEGKY